MKPMKPNKSLTFTTVKIPLPEGIDPESIAQSDAAVAELESCQKRGLLAAKKCGELWSNLKDAAPDKMLMIRWLHHRYDFSERTLYLYIDIHKRWDSQIKKAKELGKSWETLSINEFMAIGKKVKAPSKRSTLENVVAGIEHLDANLRRLTDSEMRAQVESFFRTVCDKKNGIRHVKPGTKVTVEVGDKPVLLMPNTPLTDSHVSPSEVLAYSRTKAVPKVA
jgi:hypothetical protein